MIHFNSPLKLKYIIISIIIGSLLLFLIAPSIRNYDYSSLPLSSSEPIPNKVVKILYDENIQYEFDSPNCDVLSKGKYIAGYWIESEKYESYIPIKLTKFRVIWVIDGC